MGLHCYLILYLQVFSGNNDNSNGGGNRRPNPNLQLSNSSRGGNPRNNSIGLAGPVKMSFRGGRGGDGHVRSARGTFNRERLAPRGWSPSQRSNDLYGRPSNLDSHFNSAGRNNRSNIGGGNVQQQQQQQQQQKDRKMKMGQREDNRPRHVRTSMDR